MSMLTSAEESITHAAKKLGLHDEQIKRILTPDAIHAFDIEVNGKKHQAYRAQHSSKRGPYKGGVRFHPQVNEDEVRALALLMGIKTAAVGIPMGGGKGGVAFDPREHDPAHVEAVSRAFVQYLHPHIGPDKDIPAPDVNTNAAIIDAMVDEYERLSGDTTKASFTGKSIDKGGSLGREAATGRGGMFVLREYLHDRGLDPRTITVAVQGIGNVGFWFAKLAQEVLGVRIIAVSNSRHTLAMKDTAQTLDFTQFTDHAKSVFDDLQSDNTQLLERDAILGMNVDILVLAALENVITAENADTVQAATILELANGPIEAGAMPILNERTIDVIPDIIANAGGVVVSYLEWLQNKSSERWDEAKVNRQLDEIQTAAARKMLALAKEKQVSLKDAGLMLALKELAE